MSGLFVVVTILLCIALLILFVEIIIFENGHIISRKDVGTMITNVCAIHVTVFPHTEVLAENGPGKCPGRHRKHEVLSPHF